MQKKYLKIESFIQPFIWSFVLQVRTWRHFVRQDNFCTFASGITNKLYKWVPLSGLSFFDVVIYLRIFIELSHFSLRQKHILMDELIEVLDDIFCGLSIEAGLLDKEKNDRQSKETIETGELLALKKDELK